jgi:hypothetical protein
MLVAAYRRLAAELHANWSPADRFVLFGRIELNIANSIESASHRALPSASVFL